MKPPPFAYVSVSDLDEAVAVLAEHGDDSKVLAGGQSLVPMMNFRLARPGVLVDLNRLASLSYIDEDGDSLRIGALTRHHTIATSEVVRRRCPLLAEAAAHVGYPAIRRRGTIGGSLAHADPVAELACIAVALDADIVVRGPRGDRTVPASEFFVSVFTTALEPDEILTEIRLASPAAHVDRWGFQEFSRKHGDFALIMCAASLEGDDGVIRRARIGIAGVGETAVRGADGERVLEGNRPDEDLVAAACEAIAASVEPRSDFHASAAFRRHLVQVLTSRAIRDALDRSGW